MRRILLTSLAAAAATFAANALAAPAPHYSGEALAGQAKVSLSQARATALKARAGKIVDQELEKEPGGAGLRYSFDVMSGGKTYEVGVDAKTGRILENAAETAAQEAAEARADAATRHGQAMAASKGRSK